MKGDNPDGLKPVSPVALFRGVYDRVAKRLGVDPSYVSRVARGERKSAEVEKALTDEVRAIRDHLNTQNVSFGGHDGTAHDGAGPAATAKPDGALRDGASRDGVLHEEKTRDHHVLAKHDGVVKRVVARGPVALGKKLKATSKAAAPKA